MSGKAIVLDAKILIRAVLEKRVRELIFDNAATIKFFAPDAQRCVGAARGLATPRPGMPGCSNAARLMKLDTSTPVRVRSCEGSLVEPVGRRC